MTAGEAAAFACQRRHPVYGELALCARQRHHAGKHRTTHDGRLVEWADSAYAPGGYVPPVTPFVVAGRMFGKTIPLEPVQHDYLDEQTETWLEGEGRRPLFGYVPATVLEAAIGLVWALVVVALVVYIA